MQAERVQEMGVKEEMKKWMESRDGHANAIN